VASVWITTRPTKNGGKRHRVEYRLGGSRTRIRYGGSFRRKQDAAARRNWIAGELAARRVPTFEPLDAERPRPPRLSAAKKRWQAARVDVAETTARQHGIDLDRAQRVLGDPYIDEITPDDVIRVVVTLAAESYARETIKKTRNALAMVFDHFAIDPNPARDPRVKLPRENREEPVPPLAEHVEAVFSLMPRIHRLALLWLDWSGARVASVDKLLVGDYDERNRRVRLRRSISKTNKALWVELPAVYADALECSFGPREDRNPAARMFAESGADALRTAIAKACRALGVPLFSPHDLRHRRISVMHAQGRTWAEIGLFVGQRSLHVTADTYTHVIADPTEVDYERLLNGAE
jgi:integrase